MRRHKTRIQFLGLLAICVLAAMPAAAQTPSPALLVLEKNDNTLAIVDPASLKVVGRVPCGKDPHEVAASADGKRAYVTNYGGGGPNALKTISVIDLVTQKALPAVDLGALRGPHGIEFVDGKVYFTAEVNKVIGRYDPDAKQIDWILGTGQNRTHMLAVNKDLSRIFTSNVNSDTISIIEKTPNGNDWSETPVAVGKGPEGFDVSPDGKEVWAANSGDGTVSVMDVAEKKVIQTIEAQTRHSNRLKFTLDGKLVFVSDLGGSDFVVLDAAVRKVVKRINIGRSAEGVLMSPDGSRVFVSVSPDNNVAVVDLKSLEVTGRIPTGAGPDGLAWAQRK